MENSHEVGEVSQNEGNAHANQIDLLAQNVDHLSVNDNSGSSKPDANVVQGEEVRAVIDPQNERMNEYVLLDALLPFESLEQIPGCHKCTINACNDSWCNFCTRGFCHKGQLCKNIYSHFAMCGKETNFCKENRLRNSQNDRYVRRIQNSGHGRKMCPLWKEKMRERLKKF